jgi:pantothenate kinase
MAMTETMDKLDFSGLVERCWALLKKKQRESDHAARLSGRDQVFIGVAGTPGSGKSFVAERVRDIINKDHPDLALVIPMDGYHYSKKKLRELAKNGDLFHKDQQEKQTMTYEQLMARRGAPWTFCPASLIKDLKEAISKGEGSFPVYDREKHDPVSDGAFLTKKNWIIFVEGNYLLCIDDPDWKPLDEIWDDKWYVDVSLENARERLVKRHLKNWNEEKILQWGEGRKGAEAKTDTNDMKNAQCIRKRSVPHANLIIDNNAEL